MKSKTEQRQSCRVEFERGYPANMMAIDGTWRRGCTLMDVSDTGARLMVESSIKGLSLKEFFFAALLARSGLPPLPTSLGQWRSDRGDFPEQKPGKRKTGLERESRLWMTAPMIRR